MESSYSYIAAGKTRYPRKAQTAVSYEHLDRDFITASRRDAAACRLHHSHSTSLPKIATGRSIRSAKKLWEEHECIEVRSRVQRESEKQPEVPPLRVPKNPHGLYKHAAPTVQPFHILHSPSDYGQAKHQLRQLYAQVTYLSNAVRNCDGSASYRGMCKRQRSYCSTESNNPIRLHWPSSDESKPVPRLLLPVTPGTNTKWYSWKVDTPRGEASPRGRGGHGRSDKRLTASAPVSRSLDFLERYGKNIDRVAFSVDDAGGRQLRNTEEADTKSRDGRLGVKTLDRTDITECLASSSLSSIMKCDASKFKLGEDEGIAGKAVFLTQPETRKSPSAEEVQTDGVGVGCHGDHEDKVKTKTEPQERSPSEGGDVHKRNEEKADAIREQSPDETDIVAGANVAQTDKPQENTISDVPQNSTQDGAGSSQLLKCEDKMVEQVGTATGDEPDEAGADNGHENADNSGHPHQDTEQMVQSMENISVTMGTRIDIQMDTRPSEIPVTMTTKLKI